MYVERDGSGAFVIQGHGRQIVGQRIILLWDIVIYI